MPLEWLIDLIKEWVIAQAYATKAWVLAKLYLQKAEYPGYFMPVHVTGDPTPDVTCLYCRYGDYNEKPVYVREDSAYFIWWTGTMWIIGTSVPGGPPTRKFFRNDPSVFGDYTPSPGSSGTATVISGYKYLLTGFVHRGDPIAPDFDIGDFIQDRNWHSLNLSGIVPAGAKAVAIGVDLVCLQVNKHLNLRRAGQTFGVNISFTTIQVSSQGFTADVIVAVDENRCIEYMTGVADWTVITLWIKGWWF